MTYEKQEALLRVVQQFIQMVEDEKIAATDWTGKDLAKLYEFAQWAAS